MEEAHHSQLLNDEWDFSDSRSMNEGEEDIEYPEDDDRII